MKSLFPKIVFSALMLSVLLASLAVMPAIGAGNPSTFGGGMARNAPCSANNIIGLTASIDFGYIEVKPSTAIGYPISRVVSTPTAYPGHTGGPCTYWPSGYGVSAQSSLTPSGVASVPPGGTVYKTNIPGVGILFTATPYQLVVDSCLPSNYNQPVTLPFSITWPSTCDAVDGHPTQFTAALIKIGPIQSGACQMAQPVASQTANGTPVYTLQNVTCTIVAQNPTCEIIAGDVTKTVTLPTVNSLVFQNSQSAGDTPFTITAGNCQSANAATFTFAGTSDAANPVLFKNTGTATGVGVRIYPASNTSQTIGANGTNNVQRVNVSGGRAVLSLGAQYYKASAAVGAGTVSAKATVTATYN